MAIVYQNGFDYYGTSAQMQADGWTISNTTVGQTGRFAGSSAVVNGSIGNAISHPLGTTYTELYAGFAFKSARGAITIAPLFQRSGVITNLTLGQNGSNQITLINAAGSTVATGTTIINVGTWYYIEVHILVNGASGSAAVHLNGGVEITDTTSNFGTVGTQSVDTVALGSSSNFGHTYDDLYVLDTTGSAPRNTYLGDVNLVSLYPTSDGAHTDFTPSGAGSHFSKVNNATPDDDTTYNASSTVTNIDSYGYGDVANGSVVYSVRVVTYARKDDANIRQFAPLIRQASTDYVGNTFTLGSNYMFFSQIYQQDPTNTDWTYTNVNADEFGFKLVA